MTSQHDDPASLSSVPSTNSEAETPVSRRVWLTRVMGVGGVVAALATGGCESGGGHQTRRQRGQRRPEMDMIRRRSMRR